MGCGLECRVDFPHLLDVVRRDVAWHVCVDEVLRSSGLGHADDSGQRVVGNPDSPSRVLRGITVARHDHRDGLADVMEGFPGQDVRRLRMSEGWMWIRSGTAR